MAAYRRTLDERALPLMVEAACWLMRRTLPLRGRCPPQLWVTEVGAPNCAGARSGGGRSLPVLSRRGVRPGKGWPAQHFGELAQGWRRGLRRVAGGIGEGTRHR